MNNDLATLFGGNPFDPSTVEPQGDFSVIPPGETPVLIEEAEVRQTKKGDGHYVWLSLKVLKGPYVNRKLFDQINVDNPSAQCVEIGLRTLSALGRAIGLSTITDSAQLVNQVVIAHVKVKGDQNNIRTYSSTADKDSIGSDGIKYATPGLPPNQPQVTQSAPATAAPTPTPQPENAARVVGGTTTAPTGKPRWAR